MWYLPVSLVSKLILCIILFCIPCTEGLIIVSGQYRKIGQSNNGFEYLQSFSHDVQSNIACASLCLQTEDCTGFVFEEKATSCRLVNEFCGGSVFQPEKGDLYSKLNECPTSKGYKFVDIGGYCDYCVRVSGDSDELLNYDNARRRCQAEGGNLLHFEGEDTYDFTKLGNYFPLFFSRKQANYWVSINTLDSTQHEAMQWDNSRRNLTDDEFLNIPWAPNEPTMNKDQICVYLDEYLTNFADSECSQMNKYICMADI